MVTEMKMSIDHRILVSFWLFGLLNNVLYVVILTAAVDLVGALVPKASVLLADVLPAFLIKVVAPFFIHLIPYNHRIFAMVALDVVGMLIIAFAGSIPMKLFGITLASLSSGCGELTFLQLTHYFNDKALKGFSSGTGGAGLVGSFCYMVLTTWMGLSVKATLLLFCAVPFAFFYTYFAMLPDPIKTFNDLTRLRDLEEEQTLISNDLNVAKLAFDRDSLDQLRAHVSDTLGRLRQLVVPFMVPLFTVYFSEYTINQGISPTLLFPIEDTPFGHYRDLYVAYGTLYQLGVFVSRSSTSFVRIKKVYVPSLLQMLNLVICVWQSLYMVIPNVYLMMILVFYEGLLGGASYVNTFMLVSETIPVQDREFAMGAVGMSDSAGIVLAASLSMWLEPRLCAFQVDGGRPWCRME